MFKRLAAPTLLLSTAVLLSGCNQSTASTASVAPPPQPIDVAQVLTTQVQNWHTFSTRLQAPQEVELRPRISGVVESIEFIEGAIVKEGDLLIRLDPRPFAAEVNRLKAQLLSAKAALKQAEGEAARANRLSGKSAISKEEAEARQSQAQQRAADVASVRAALDAAQLNLEFTEIRAPITGRVSRAIITPGNTVTSGQSVLTTLVSVDKVHAYFYVDERTWNTDFSDVVAASNQSVALQLTGDNGFAHEGQLDFIDPSINAQTGTLRVRAVFDGDDPRLRPGAFVRVRMAENRAHDAVLVPDRAIGTDLKNRFILTVDANNTLQYRQVELGQRIGKLRVIETGLSGDETIAVNGPARVGPGMTVSPNTITLDIPQQALLADAHQPEIGSPQPLSSNNG